MPMHVEIYPQTDLFNLAYYHMRAIEHKESEGNADGLEMDCMACLLALGVTLEAIINNAATKAIPDWKPEEPRESETKKPDSHYEQKLAALSEALEIKLDYGQKPFQSLRKVRKARNAMAHAFPTVAEKEIEPGKDMKTVMETKWDKYAVPKITREIYQDVNTFEKMVYSALGMDYAPATCATGWIADRQK